VLVVPASSAKTYDPNAQFMRARSASAFAAEMSSFGVVVDFQQIAKDVLGYWDPYLGSKWIVDPKEQGPGGLPPVYEVLKKLSESAQQSSDGIEKLMEAVQGTSKLALENSERLDEDDEKEARRLGEANA
jgi:hypothetical protein